MISIDCCSKFYLQYQKFLHHPSFSWILSRNLKWLNFAPRIAGLITGGPAFIPAIQISIQLNFWANYEQILEKPQFLRAFWREIFPFTVAAASIFQHDRPTTGLAARFCPEIGSPNSSEAAPKNMGTPNNNAICWLGRPTGTGKWCTLNGTGARLGDAGRRFDDFDGCGKDPSNQLPAFWEGELNLGKKTIWWLQGIVPMPSILWYNYLPNQIWYA